MKSVIRLIDTFLNCGLPQFADRLVKNSGNIYKFTKSEIKIMFDKVKDFDRYYLKGWKVSTTRAMLKSIVNEWCETYRTSSLIID